MVRGEREEEGGDDAVGRVESRQPHAHFHCLPPLTEPKTEEGVKSSS